MAKEKDLTADRAVRLVRLEELKSFQVAEGDHDIRGWEVKTPDGRKIGKVEELIVDPYERRVRYMEVKVSREVLSAEQDRHVLVPIGAARLQEDGNNVLIERLPAQGIAGVPAYTRGPITREYETSLRQYYGATAVDTSTDYYRDDLYSDRGFRRPAPGTDAGEISALPKLGDNEVTVPLMEDQEIVIRRPGSEEEIVIRKKTTGDAETRS